MCAADMELLDSENHESLKRIETYIPYNGPTGLTLTTQDCSGFNHFASSSPFSPSQDKGLDVPPVNSQDPSLKRRKTVIRL